MDTLLVLIFFVGVIFFGLFYGSKKAMIATLVSLVATEIYVISRIFIVKHGAILPGAILSVFFVGYFLLIFTLIRYYLNKDDRQRMLFTEYYDDAVRKYEMLEKEEASLRNENVKLEKELNDTVSFYENIKGITATLDFTRKLELMAGFIKSIADFSEGKLILIGMNDGVRQVEKVYNISAVNGMDRRIVYEADIRESGEFYEKMLDEFGRGFSALFTDLSLRNPYKGIIKGNYRTAGAIPLSSENELMGIVLVFDIDRKGFEKIQTLAPQLAMELKKIKLYEKVRELSIIDGLTGLYLRRHFLSILESEIERADRNKQPISFLIADIDNFKIFNDRYGHLAGDILLRDLAGILKREARSVDLIGRYGGDEIAMAFPRTDVNIALQVAERMRSVVKASAVARDDEDVKISLSIGISAYPLNCGSLAEMIEKADQALYKAKEQGRDKVVVYS